jgi:hypothetical protein
MSESKKLLVFLSHASQDKPAVRELSRQLRADGFDPWLDEERLLPGMDWNLEIKKAMRASDAILVCFSKLSVAKEGYVQREYKKAMEYQEEKPEGTIFVIPVRLDDCQPPDLTSEIQWVDYPAGYERLRVSLNLRSGKLASAPPLPVHAPSIPVVPTTSAQINPLTPPSTGEIKTSSGRTYNITGGIHAGRDVVLGDQYNYITQQAEKAQTPAEFVEALTAVKKELEALQQDPQRSGPQKQIVAMAGDLVQKAAEETQQEKPDVEGIQKWLQDAGETLGMLSGSVEKAAALGVTIGNLALLAFKLFGG